MTEKKSYYFSHDSNARNDVKIIQLIRYAGLKGYGIYWCLIEILRETAGYKLNFDSVEDIAYSLHIDASGILDVVNNYELFTCTQTEFFSECLQRNMDKLNETSQRLSAAAKAGAAQRAKQKTKK